MGSYENNRHIYTYMEMVESGKIRACREQKLLMSMVQKCFAKEDIYVDDEQLEHYLGLAKYFPFQQVFPWEAFVIGLSLCTFWQEVGTPRWSDSFNMLGRGAGKDGLIALESMALISPYNPITGYDVDICANNETQAMRPVKDIYEALEAPQHKQKLKKYYYWTKERVQGRKNRGIVTGHTNNPGGKDGLRSGVVIFNEIHQYQNAENLNVFTTGLGKKSHPRRIFFTTQGDVREGPLDEKLEEAEAILAYEEPDNGLLPFICKLDSKEEVHDPKNWEKANPSLPYNQTLRQETEKEYREWKKSPDQLPAFMTKRMNIPEGRRNVEVTPWENVMATKRNLPDMTGWACTVGIDYASISDWASVNFHFRREEARFDINHSWLCLQSKDLERIKAPWQEWVKQGLLTVVDRPEIPADMLTEYIRDMAKKYFIKMLSLDKFRYDLLAKKLGKIGFDQAFGNLYLTRPSDIMRVQPVIGSCFANQLFYWDDNPPLRWAVGNTKLVRSGKREGTDTGNFYYAKIEGKSRKTDPFMSLVHSMVVEDRLPADDGDSPQKFGIIYG